MSSARAANPAARRLHHVTLECRPALELIDRYGAHEGVLLYVDPPYLGSARGYGNAYRHEMRTSEEHRGLAEALHRCKAAVVLSGYASDLYDLELYPDWHRVTFATGTVPSRSSTQIFTKSTFRVASSRTVARASASVVTP